MRGETEIVSLQDGNFLHWRNGMINLVMGRAGKVSWLWGEQEKCWPTIMQELYEKGPPDHNSPICILSQNGSGDQRVKGTRRACCLPLERSQLYTCTGRAGEVFTERTREASVISHARRQLAAGRFRKMLAWPQQPNLYLQPKWLLCGQSRMDFLSITLSTWSFCHGARRTAPGFA